MTVQHLEQFEETERNDDSHYQEKSSLLHSDVKDNENSQLVRISHRGGIVLICCIAVVLFTRGFIKQPQEQRANNNLRQPMKLSLWLIPPPPVADVLGEQISFYSKTSGGPYFDPHVTVTGGIKCRSRHDATRVLNLLQQELSGFGEISAVFEPKATNEDVWNQGLVVEMDTTPKFVRLCQRVRELLDMDTTNLFPPPLGAPHLSLYYGVDNVPLAEEAEPVPNFKSDKLALWITEPTNTAGVPQWKFFGAISLA